MSHYTRILYLLIRKGTNDFTRNIFQTPSNVFPNAKPYEAPKQTSTLPAFTSGYNQVHAGKLLKSVQTLYRGTDYSGTVVRLSADC